MEILNSKKAYKVPQTKVFEVNVHDMLCSSVDGSFGLSNNGNVERGNDSDWGEDLDW